MPRIACATGALVVGAVLASCGPPAPPLGGTLSYTDSCRVDPANNHFACTGGGVFAGNNGDNSGSQRLIVACFISQSGGATRLSFRLGRTDDPTSPTPREGISACGDVSGPGSDLTSGALTLYFQTGTTAATSLPGPCEVKINALTPTGSSPGFSGQIRCMDVPDNGVPSQLHNIGGTGMTTDPMWADFEVHPCSTNFEPCS
jgi:hypothetical protein